MAKKSITVTISASSHPDYDYFGSTVINRRQIAKRGTRTELDRWYDAIANAAKAHDVSVTLINE